MYCNVCKKAVNINAKYCPKCGKKIESSKFCKKKKKSLILIIFLTSFVIIWFAIVIFLGYKLIVKGIDIIKIYTVDGLYGIWKIDSSNELIYLNEDKTYEITDYILNSKCNGTYSIELGYQVKTNNSNKYYFIKNNTAYYTIIFNDLVQCNYKSESNIIKGTDYTISFNLNDKTQGTIMNTSTNEKKVIIKSKNNY